MYFTLNFPCFKQGFLLQRENKNAGAATTVRRWLEAHSLNAQEGNGLEGKDGEELSDCSPREARVSLSVSTHVLKPGSISAVYTQSQPVVGPTSISDCWIVGPRRRRWPISSCHGTPFPNHIHTFNRFYGIPAFDSTKLIYISAHERSYKLC